MSAAQSTAGLSPPPDPAQDRSGKPVPARIGEILAVLSVLTAYGRHLAATLEQRSVARGFATIARYFGTATVDTIMAHILRGLMRASALQRILLRRAARGRDLRIPTPRTVSDLEPPGEATANAGLLAASPPPEALTPAEPAAAPAAASDAGEQLVRRIARNQPLTLDTMPSMEAIEAQVHRCPIGRTLAAICRDLGISPSLCDGMFWNRLFDAIRLHRGSIPSLVLEVKRQEQRFEKDEWKHPGLEWPEETRAGIRRVVGFMIGEDAGDPFAVAAAPGAPVAAAATGPP
jgi:hypothetical protein